MLILLGPDGSREDGAGHRGGICLQAGVASAGGGAILPQIPLDRGAGEVDPGAAAWRHQFGGEQEPNHVGHHTHNRSSFFFLFSVIHLEISPIFQLHDSIFTKRYYHMEFKTLYQVYASFYTLMLTNS